MRAKTCKQHNVKLLSHGLLRMGKCAYSKSSLARCDHIYIIRAATVCLVSRMIFLLRIISLNALPRVATLQPCQHFVSIFYFFVLAV